MEDGEPRAGGRRGARGDHQARQGDGGEIRTLLRHDHHLQVREGYICIYPDRGGLMDGGKIFTATEKFQSVLIN